MFQVDTINQLKTNREFFLSFSKDPQQFIQKWLVSQSRDLKVRMLHCIIICVFFGLFLYCLLTYYSLPREGFGLSRIRSRRVFNFLIQLLKKWRIAGTYSVRHVGYTYSCFFIHLSRTRGPLSQLSKTWWLVFLTNYEVFTKKIIEVFDWFMQIRTYI